MPRIDAALAQQLTAGSEAALRRLIDGIASGQPNYSELQPLRAAETKKQLPQLQALLTSLGALQAVEFEGVGNAGWDVYKRRYEHGSMQWRIAVSSAGVIAGALGSAGP